MKRTRILGIIALSIFVLSVFGISAVFTTAATPGTPTVGDTLIYEVTEFTAPDIVNLATEGAGSSDIDLKGSQVGFKILSANTTMYMYGVYVKTDKDMSITINGDELEADALSMLQAFLTSSGDLKIGLPGGVAFPLIEKEMSDYNWGDSLPIWMKNVDWTAVQTEVEGDGGTYKDNGDTVTLSMTETEEDGQEMTISITFTKGTDVVFTKLSISAKVIMDETTTLRDVSATIEYKETKALPLSSEIGVGDKLIYKLDSASLDIEYNLNDDAKTLINTMLSGGEGATNIDAMIGAMEGQVTGMVGQEYMSVTITGIDGVLYTADVSMEGEEAQEVFFNGFVGAGTSEDEWGYEETWGDGTAPVITGDWDLYDGYMKLADAAMDVLTTIVDADTAGDDLKGNYTAMGMTSGPDLGFDSSLEGSSTRTMKIAMSMKMKMDVSKMDKEYLGIPDDAVMPEGTMEMSMDMVAGQAYSEDGILLGIGMTASMNTKFDITIPAELIPGGAQTGVDMVFKGDVSADLDMQIKLDSSSTGVDNAVSDAASLDKVVDDDDFAGVAGGGAPGFELFAVLAGLVAIPVINKKRK